MMEANSVNSENVVIQDVATSAIILANIAEVAAVTVRKIAGNDLSTALNGETLTKDNLANMVLSVASSELSR